MEKLMQNDLCGGREKDHRRKLETSGHGFSGWFVT